eukprot:4482671-Prymnesium_polylepis.1
MTCACVCEDDVACVRSGARGRHAAHAEGGACKALQCSSEGARSPPFLKVVKGGRRAVARHQDGKVGRCGLVDDGQYGADLSGKLLPAEPAAGADKVLAADRQPHPCVRIGGEVGWRRLRWRPRGVRAKVEEVRGAARAPSVGAYAPRQVPLAQVVLRVAGTRRAVASVASPVESPVLRHGLLGAA